jgi:murein L,D-transpeptidase YafK
VGHKRWIAVLGIPFVCVALLLSAFAPNRALTPLPASARADFVLVEKTAHRMTLFAQHRPLRTYDIALGRGGLARKTREGDARTPEGLYRIDRHNPHSAFHRSLHINYPSKQDIATAKAQHVSPGGGIMIHGLQNGFGWIGTGHRMIDWTNGCIAVADDEIDEIYRVVPDGTPVEIRH